MRLLLSIILLSMSVVPAAAQGWKCPDAAPANSPAWRNFSQSVQSEYGSVPASDRGQSLIYGHAMGRMEKALNGNVMRNWALACVKEKLERDFLNNAVTGRLDGFDWYLAQEAAQGRHNAEVARISGVKTQAPLHKAFEQSLAAGPVVGGRPGGGGVRIAIREGSRPKPNADLPWNGGSGNSAPENTDGPNWDDLPNSEVRSDTGHWHRGFMMQAVNGMLDEKQWRFPHEYSSCIPFAQNADRGDTKFARGLRKGTVLIVGWETNKRYKEHTKFRCFQSVAPFENVYMKEMDERAAKSLAFCKRQQNMHWCKPWFMN